MAIVCFGHDIVSTRLDFQSLAISMTSLFIEPMIHTYFQKQTDKTVFNKLLTYL